MLTKIRNLIGDEPVRVYVHTAVVAALGVLALKGVITEEDALEYGAVAALVLGVEGLRSKVTPARKAREDAEREAAGIAPH